MDIDKKSVKLSVSNRTIVRVLLIAVVFCLLVKFVIRVDHVLKLIFVSAFLAIAISPAVSSISKNLKLKSRAFATSIAYVLVVVIIGAFVVFAFPPIIKQSINFAESSPRYLTSAQNPHSTAGKIVKKYHLSTLVSNLDKSLKQHTQNLQGPVLSTATKAGSVVISILTVFVLTFMMTVEGPRWVDRISKLKSYKHKQWHNEIAKRMYKIVVGYFYGQFLLAILGGIIAYIALEITSHLFHVSVNSVALAGIVVLTGLIPLVGHIIGGFIVTLVCLFVSWPLALTMAVILLVYQQIENVTIQPYIQAKYNELSPLIVLIAALIGVEAGGILGAFVAIPIAGCLKVAIQIYLEKRHLVE